LNTFKKPNTAEWRGNLFGIPGGVTLKTASDPTIKEKII